MLLIIARDGDEIDVEITDIFSEALAATIKKIREGYVQYKSYHRFMDDGDEVVKRMLLVEGKVV